MDVYGIELVGKILRTPIKDHGVKLLLVAIAQSTAPGGKTAQISNQSLQNILQRSQTVVRDLVNKAISDRLLTRNPTVKLDGRQGANAYRVIVPTVEKLLDGIISTPRNSGGYSCEEVELIVSPPEFRTLRDSGASSDMSNTLINQKAPRNSGAYSDMSEERGVTRGVTPSELIHELNLNELNSGEKFSTGQPETAVLDEIARYNARKVENFTPAEHLLKWAAHNCPLVPIQTATAQWREWVLARMLSKLKNPTAHWREYLRNQQAWREQEEQEKADLFIGASKAAPARLESPAPASQAAAPTPTTAPPIEPSFDAVEAALQSMPVEAVTALREQIAQEIRAKVGDKFDWLWDEEVRRTTINARLRGIIVEQLEASRNDKAA